MVDSKLSALAPAAAPADTDLFYTVQGGVSLKQTALALKSYAGAMSIGEAIVGGTSPQLLYVGPGSVLAQMANLPTSYLNSGTGANGSTFWRGDGAWGPAVAWVPYTGPPQSFLAQQMTRDGDWTMVANTNTNDRPAPQATGDEVDLLPPWTPAVLNARATYTVVNEWTLSQSGWINQYGIDVIAQNVGATHTVTLKVNGTIKDTFTSVPSTSELYMHDVTPIVAVSGAVIDVTLQVTMIPPNNQMYWYQQPGLFATAPTYTSLAQGSKDGGAMSTTAYGCHLTFIPGTVSPDWDIVAFGGSAAGGAPAGGGVSIGDAVIGGTANSVLFVGSGGVLAQDNANFNWDDAAFILKAGAQLQQLVNGAFVPALYPVYNSVTNNWFVANAGNLTVTGSGNIGFGDQALAALTSGSNNLGIGGPSGDSISAGFGSAAGFLTAGQINVAIGPGSLAANTSGSFNVAIGANAIMVDPGDDKNVGIGANSLISLTGGTQNTAIGYSALLSLVSGDKNIAIGGLSGNFISSGSNNLILGYSAANNLGSGSDNTLIGNWAGPGSGSLSSVIAFSDGAGNLQLDYNYTSPGTWNFSSVLPAKTTPVPADGIVLQDSAASNGLKVAPWSSLLSIGGVVTGGTAGSVLFVGPGGVLAQDNANFNWDDTTDILLAGKQLNLLLNGASTRALYAIYNSGGDNWFAAEAGNPAGSITGVNNLGFGVGALYNLTSGNNNVCLGHLAGVNLTTGSDNLVAGASALINAMASSSNFALGVSSLASYTGVGSVLGIGAETFYNLTTGTNNIAIGPYAAHSMTSGGTNVFIGIQAGYNITGGNNNVVLGSWQGPSGSISNAIVLSDGTGNPRVDYNYTNADTWSFQYTTNPIGIHVYGVTDGGGPPVNYERAVFDWNVTANMLTIGTQAGGTGVLRPIKFTPLPSKASPVAADTLLLQDSAAGGTLAAVAWSSLPSGGGGMSIGGAVTGGTAGSVLFIDGSGDLGQDNASFSWDDANDRLHIGHSGSLTSALYVDALPALFEMPNASGNNWFEGNAGNFTLTGNGNFGTGDGALGRLTTGNQNLAVGYNACFNITTGSKNVGFGSQALSAVTTGDSNTALGSSAGLQITTGGTNFLMGEQAGSLITTGSNNTALGASALANLSGAGQQDGNTGIGSYAFSGFVSGKYNTGMGQSVGTHFTSGTGNLFVGIWSGFNITGGNYNTILGGWSGPAASISNVIAIVDGYDAIYVDDGTVRGVDYNYTKAGVWSFQYMTTPIGLHIYNTINSGGTATNYERVVLDWNLTSNVARLASQAGGTGVVRLIAIDGFQKAGAPAAADLPSGTMALINDTSGGQTWLAYNAAGTIRKVQLV